MLCFDKLTYEHKNKNKQYFTCSLNAWMGERTRFINNRPSEAAGATRRNYKKVIPRSMFHEIPPDGTWQTILKL